MSFYTDFAGHYESIFPLEEDAYRFLLARTPGRAGVLDIGCGTGDYCGRFTEDGHESVGLDLDREMVEVAARRFPRATFLAMDMKDVASVGGAFGSVFCIGNVLSHLPATGLSQFVRDVAGLVEPGGSWIFQTVNWDHILTMKSFRFPDVTVAGEDLVFEREYPRVSRESTPFMTRLRRGGEMLFEGEVELYPVLAQEYLSAHIREGFVPRGHFADWRGSAFDAGRMSSSIMHFVRR